MTQVAEQRQAKQEVIKEIIDGDGHIYEADEELYPYFDHTKHPVGRLRRYYLFPDLDGSRRIGAGGWEFGVDAGGWLKFMDQLKLSSAVLYPTAGLGYAFVRDPGWATDLARAYNDWLYDQFLKKTPRLKGIALIPVQDPPAAAQELRRAVTELGMVGAVLPAPGLPSWYGDAAFDVLYQEAQALGVMLAVHGASWRGFGLDTYRRGSLFGAGANLAHPFAQIVNFTDMIGQGVFERFPRLKVAFLEAGCGWVPYWLERMDRTSRRRGRPLASETVRNCPIYFHAELEEESSLSHTISVIGDSRLIYASDYPHEPDDGIRDALEGFLAREDLSLASKRKILCDNIKELYTMK